MKNLTALLIAFIFLSVTFTKATYAQNEENRMKMQMTISYGGKTIVTELNSVATALTRGYDEQPAAPAVKDSLKSKLPANPGTVYLTVDAKKIGDELLTVFAKKQNHFDGSISIVDSYGKNPPRTIKFKRASLYSYSEQLSTGTYSDSFGAYAISLNCQEISINGITIEQ